ncbi:HAD family phosphatase [Paraconexibacter antarcticus]|uniref:HAD family phosphatase n=1 Tax=Paraconexibacter antarcticus TaxID=2949664 RepID=A0ABY5DR76_9ACTN|nr:HAD family phosphatase [Paraconexibacter antarcticus]UTI64151.1 HAD family phosphatase [Paraconexibacter antarcticus]
MPRRLPPAAPRGVVFDNDGLLLDTEEAWTRAEDVLWARRGLTFTVEQKLRLIGSSGTVLQRSLEVLLGEPEGSGPALVDELHELVMEEALKPISPRPGALALIAVLQEAGLPMAVASNSPRVFLDRVLGGAGLNGASSPFAATVAGDEVANYKPAPDIYLEACARLGIAPADAVAFEDSPPGVAAAAAAGIHVVGIPYIADGELPGADAVATALDDPAVLALFGA